GAIPVFSVPVVEAGEGGGAGGAGTQPAGGNNGGTPIAQAANGSVRAVTVGLEQVTGKPSFVAVHRPTQILATVANSGGVDLTNVPVVLETDAGSAGGAGGGKQVLTRTIPTLAVGDATTV